MHALFLVVICVSCRSAAVVQNFDVEGPGRQVDGRADGRTGGRLDGWTAGPWTGESVFAVHGTPPTCTEDGLKRAALKSSAWSAGLNAYD